jgi:hypothetical protein
MKRIYIIVLALTIFMLSCQTKQTNPFEGNWELIHAEGTYGVGGEMIKINMNKDANNYGMKMIHDNYFMTLGQDIISGVLTANYGYGTYTLKDNIYTENIIYHVDKGSIGKSPSYEMTVKGDTLLQKGPLKIGEFKDINYEFTETYIRR